MDTATGLIAVIPASRKDAWEAVKAAVAFTRECREIMKAVVASDQPWMAQANEAGAWFFEAKGERLAAEAPRFELLSEVAEWSERQDGDVVRLIVHLDPNRPMQDPLTVYECLQRLLVNAFADGVLGVKAGGAGLTETDGWLEVDPNGRLTLDPAILVFRRAFVDEHPEDWLKSGQFLPYHAPADAGPRGGLM